MRRFSKRACIVIFLCVQAGTAPTSAQTKQRYTVDELIEKIIESENKIKDVQAEYLFFESDTNLPFRYAQWAYQADKEIIAGLRYEKAGSNLGYTASGKVIYYLDGEQRFCQFSEDLLRGHKGVITRTPTFHDLDTFNVFMAPNSLLGFGVGLRLSLGKALQQAQEVTLREQTERIDGHDCFVLEAAAITKHKTVYDVRIWIDADRGFRPLLIEKFYNILGNRKYPPFERLSRRVYDIRLREINGIWFPVEGKRDTYRVREVLPPELEGLTEEQAKQKFSERELKDLVQKIKEVPVLSVPTREVLVDVNSVRINQGIEPDRFVVKPPGNCEVWDESEGKLYTVEDGDGTALKFEVSYLKLVRFAPPELLKVIYPDTLVGCKLDGLAQTQIGLDLHEIKGKPLLLCIWDVQQRPSRAFIRELAHHSRQLQRKGLAIVGIRASSIDENELKEWVETNHISFPVVMTETNDQATSLAWAAKSLPWLIKTNKNHIIVAEGFGLDELSEKIAETENGEH